MFCTQCGTELKDGSRFCTNCGTPLAEDGGGATDAAAAAAAGAAAAEASEPAAASSEGAAIAEEGETRVLEAAVAEPVAAAKEAEPAQGGSAESPDDAATEPDAAVDPFAPQTDPSSFAADETRVIDPVSEAPTTAFAAAPATAASAAPAPSAPVQPVGEPPRESRPARSGSGGKIALIVVVIVAAVAVVAFVALYALGMGPFSRGQAGEAPAVEQTQPEKEQAPEEGDALEAVVPDVTGLTRVEAQRVLEASGFAVGIVTEAEDSAVAEGTVISQTPMAGATVERGSVDLVVSAGAPEPEPEPAAPSGHRYELVRQAMTWDQAQAYCEANGGHLATIGSLEEFGQILSLLPSEGVIAVWLGGSSSSGSWNWCDGTPFLYTAWASGEPNNDGGTEDRLAMLKVNGTWSWYDVPNDISSVYDPNRIGFIVEYED